MTVTQQALRAKNPIVLRPGTIFPSSGKKTGEKRTIPAASQPHEQQETTPGESGRLETDDLSTPPAYIVNDSRKLKKWNSADEDARFLGKALCEMGNRVNQTTIENHFFFADTWYQRYPKDDKKMYQRGMKSVQEGAALSPFSVKQVYYILKTIKLYSWPDYQALAAKASANHVTIRWTHLRTIADRLGKKEYRSIRREVESELVCRQMTEKLLNERIDELAPETIRTIEKPIKSQVTSIIANLGKNVKQYDHWRNVIDRFESEFQGETLEEVVSAREQVTAALEYFDQTSRFITECREKLENLAGVTAHLVKHFTPDNATSKRAKAQQLQQQAAPLTLAEPFENDDTPKIVSLDDFQMNEDFEETDDPIFDETGNIPTSRTLARR